MSLQFGKLCSLILLEHFGEIVEKVGSDLFKCQTKALPFIVTSTKLPLEKVKQALRILIHYGFVAFQPSAMPKKAEYTLLPEKIVLLLRYPRYLLLVKTQLGDEAEMLVEELLRQGQDTASRAIIRAAARLKESSKDGNVCLVTLRDKFTTLVSKQFLMRCPVPSEEETGVPVLKIEENMLYLPPEINLKELNNIEQGKSGDAGDNSIYWRVNLDRFHLDFRDEIMVSAMTCRLDDNAGELMKLLLRQMYLRTEAWAATSNPVPFTELRDAVRKQNTHPLLGQYSDQYLKLMEEDSSGFISKIGDSSGGQYCINIKEAFTQLTWATVENIVVERFGSKAARIFRLVRAKKFVEQEQIQQIAMIPAKETKLLTYKLLEENFLQMQELRKSLSSNVPNKTFFLFYIDLNQVARMVLEMCYKAIYNAMMRREHERVENRRMIEKQQRIELITMNMREQGATSEQLAEIEEIITPPERALLGKVRTMIKRLSEAELQLDETIFILQLYLIYQL